MNVKGTKIINQMENLKGRNLCPLKEYKGEILKLTSEDKEKISMLESKIAQLECDLFKLNKRINPRMQTQQYNFWDRKIIYCESKIDYLRELIKEIKTNRFNIQRNSR